jgi:PTS system galactitol-specific IIC component
LASLAGLFYLFPIVLPYTKGNVVKTLIVGLVALLVGLWFVTDMAPAFTQAAHQVFAATQDKAAHVPDGFQAGSMDFASSLFGYCIYAAIKYVKYVGAALLALITIAMMFFNRRQILADEKRAAAGQTKETE